MKKILFIGLILVSLSSCTDNFRARNFGGKETITLPSNHKLINATWKETNLWILSQDTITKQFLFKEKSSFGALEGTIDFK